MPILVILPSRAASPLLCVLASLVLPCSLLAQGHQPAATQAATAQRPAPQSNEDTAAVAKGQSEFKSSCSFCHGEDATGSRAPDLVRSTIVAHDDKGSLLAPMIRNGRPDKGMPAFTTLKDDQLMSIVAFLHHQAYSALHSAHVPGDYPVAKLLTGKADEGKRYFFGEGGCSGCHSVTGDLKGVAARFSPVDLQQAMVYPAGREAPKSTATVIASDGKKYEGTVVHRDEFRIGVMCSDGWYRSFSAADSEISVHDPLEQHRILMNRYTDADVHNLFAFLETLK